jgi:hypothetical protein
MDKKASPQRAPKPWLIQSYNAQWDTSGLLLVHDDAIKAQMKHGDIEVDDQFQSKLQ